MTDLKVLESLYFASLEKSPTEREAFLDAACRDNSDLRQQVERLLAAQGQVGEFLASLAGTMDEPAPIEGGDPAPANPLSATEIQASADAAVGTVIAGKYKLIEEIGVGGMGTVYMALQTTPVKRSVAVKVIKAGMDSKGVLARFEAERQALAMMDHPNIARVLDAGATESGRPFFVMELVKGVPITQFCDDRKLTPNQRLELFIPVCQAIQHAHQKGIIHRDIKPGNVLVALYDDKPVPKVIDFGVAKAAGQTLTDKTLMTGFGAVVGTPEYMSPEQANLNNLDVDTRSDVYSLGVLLYELLTGATPVDRKSLGQAAVLEVLRIVREVDAPRPSAKLSTSATLPNVAAARGTEAAKLSAIVKGDLDWIVMKALEKDRVRRYDTASAFADDVRRYLTQEPIAARPPSAWYRLRKVAQRNKGALGTAAVLAGALLLGMAVSLWQAFRATAAENAARHAETLAIAEGERAQEALNDAQKAREVERQQATELRTKNTELRWSSYVADMNLANTALNESNPIRVQRLLDRHHPADDSEDLRGFEWHYLQRRLVGPLVIEAHQGFCGIAGFWDRGRIIASAGKAQPFQGWGHHQRSGWEVRFWDSLTGRPVSSGLPLARDSGIRICHVDDEMTRLVEAGLDGVITLRKLKTNETQTISSEPEKHLLGARFSLDGRLMVAVYQPTQPGVESELQEIKMWDLMKGDLVFTGNRAATPFPLSGQFTPDNKRLLYLDSGVIRAIDVATSIEQFTIPVENCEGFVIHPSGRELAALVNPSMVVFDLSTCEERLRWNVGGPAISATYRSDGRQLAVGTALGEITLWEADTGSQIDKMQGHSGPVTSLNFHPDDSRLVSGGFDGTVRLWDLKRNRDTVKVQSEQGARDWPRLYADADLLLTGFPSNEFDNTLAPPQKFIEQWNPNTGEPVRVRCQTDFPIRNACASRDGKRLYLGDGESHVTVVDALDGSQLQTWQIGSGQTSASAISDDGRWYCWSAEDCVTHVVDAMTGQEVGMLEDSEYLIQRLAFDRAGDRLAIFDNGGRLRLWDRKRLELERTIQLPNVGVHCLAFDRSGQYVAVAGGERGATIGVVYLVRCTGNSPPTPLFGHGTSFVLVAEFSPDGRRLATGGADGTVRLWDVATAQELLVLKGHSAMVTSLRFADGGKRLVSVDTNAEVRHRDARPL